jgi:P-type E1-E2 ATPase
MIELTIPGRGTLEIEHLVCDVNGTLAVDGQLLKGIAQQFSALRDKLQIHMLTANTHGKQNAIDQALRLEAVIIEKGNEAQQKADYVLQLGAAHVIAIGQGANDAAMLQEAAIGIAVLSLEGLAIETLNAADLLLPDTPSALDLLNHPMRLVASLRK